MKLELQACNIWKIISDNQVTPIEAKELEIHNNKNVLKTSMTFRAASYEVLFMILTSISTKNGLV